MNERDSGVVTKVSAWSKRSGREGTRTAGRNSDPGSAPDRSTAAAPLNLYQRARDTYHKERYHGWYPASRAALRVLIPHKWRRRAVQLLRSRFGFFLLSSWLQTWLSRRTPLGVRTLQQEDFYQAITLLPRIPPAEIESILARPVATAPAPRPDVICFSIIDWSFRYQRPQQLMSQFAAHGHRVFYLNVTQFLGPYTTPKYSIHKIRENIYEVRVAARFPPDIFRDVLEGKSLALVLRSIDDLRRDYLIDDAISYVMLSSWGRVALETRRRWGWQVIYDCMDEWENFPGIQGPLLEMEKYLVRACDLLVVTAQRLLEKWASDCRPMVLARNAADYEFLTERCRPNDLLPEIRHPIIGYYGAIAQWFDLELLADAAERRPQYTFVLLGGVFDVDVTPLRSLPNVWLLGQQPYETMPLYLYHFDACIIPFKIDAITEAANPVKFYEYLTSGKPVVSVRLPEIEEYGDCVYLAEDKDDFVAKLDAALKEDRPETIARRRSVARQNSWELRYREITAGLARATPRASIIIVSYNNLALTRLCLESIFRNTAYLNYEVIVVDNGSADGTPEYLRRLAAERADLKISLNLENCGFAHANNQGLACATGQHLILLNNDTIVPPGWLGRLLWHLRDPAVGLVGPLTNFAGNEAKVEVPYCNWMEMGSFARECARRQAHEAGDIHMLAMFCVAMRRQTWEQVGPLDEQFGLGMFEDDDYSLRVRHCGYRVICAADVFVHHFGQAAFGKLIQSGQYEPLFQENRRRFEAKWGVEWKPHRNARLKIAPHHLAEEREPQSGFRKPI